MGLIFGGGNELKKKSYTVKGKKYDELEIRSMLRYATKYDQDRILEDIKVNHIVEAECRMKKEKDPIKKRKMELLFRDGFYNFDDYGL